MSLEDDLDPFELRIILNGYLEATVDKMKQLSQFLTPPDFENLKRTFQSNNYSNRFNKVLFITTELKELAINAERFIDKLYEIENLEERNAEE